MKPTKGERFLEAFNDIDEKYLKEAMNYTMKKRFNFKPIIAIAACAALALAAVPVATHFAGNPLGTQGTTATTKAPIGASGRFTVLYAGGSADGEQLLSANLQKETDFDGSIERVINETKIGTKETVTIAGKTYTGVYVDTTRSYYYREDENNYFLETDNKKITFSINIATGVCTRFYIADEALSTEKKFTRNECYEKAIAHIKEYVDDIEAYDLTEEYEYGGRIGYLFKFFRTVNGVKTSEHIDIRVNYMGIVFSHTLYGIGEMKDIDISKLNIPNISTAVTNRMDTIYRDNTTVTKNIDSIMLSKLADGSYVLEYRVSSEVTDTKTKKTYSDLRKFVVEID